MGLGAASAAFLAACSSGSSGSTGGGSGGTMKFWDMPWAATAYNIAAQKLVASYKPASGLPSASYQVIQWANFTETFASAVASNTGPAVSTDPGEDVVAGDGEPAADHDPGRVVEMDEAGDHLADPAGRLADQPDRRPLAGPQRGYQLIEGGRELTVAGGDLGQLVQYRGRGRHRLDAAVVPAYAQDLIGAVHPDVTDVAGGAVRAVIQLAAGGDQAAADAGADLDVEQGALVRGDGPRLAKRAQVDVVLAEHRAAELGLQGAGDRGVIPARHDRRLDRGPAADIDRARQPGDQVGYRGYDALAREVSYPFGHGLSCTSFGYADLPAMVSGRADNGNPDRTFTGRRR
jgi:hypothetical protein